MKVEQHTLPQRHLNIGILSDSHGVTDPAVVAVMAQCDLVIHAGDVMADAALAVIREHTQTLAVAGNNDRGGVPNDDPQRPAEVLPDVLELNLPSGTIAVEHGHRHGFHQPEHDKLVAAHPGARAVVYGHTHQQLIEQSGTPWILNPGAAGHTRNGSGPKCLVLHIDGEQWRVVPHNFRSEH